MSNLPVVFAGPSIPPDDRRGYADLVFRPPAQAGDVLRLLPDPPPSICIVDGYFGDRMAVMHKEILQAIASGVKVYGAASIGALRAAELETYGMIGIGRVFKAYRDGECLRDDAVAVTHGPAETGYALLSLAHIDIEATARALVRRRRISGTDRDTVLHASANIHFSERTWTSLSSALNNPGLVDLFRASHVEQKRLDAIDAMRRVMRDYEMGRVGTKTGCFPPATPAYSRQIDEHCPELVLN